MSVVALVSLVSCMSFVSVVSVVSFVPFVSFVSFVSFVVHLTPKTAFALSAKPAYTVGHSARRRRMTSMSRVNWITHKDKQILYSDYRGLREKEVVEVYVEGEEILARLPAPTMTLGDFRGAYVGVNLMKIVKERGGLHTEKINKVALLGITGLKGILLEGYMHVWGDVMRDRVKLFETEEEAKEWLAK